jgi:hypothetical protein
VNSLYRGMMSWVPAAILFAGIAFWRITADYETVVLRVICAVTCLAAIRASRNAKYFRVAAFGGIAVLFNPIVPDLVSRIAFSGLYFVCASTVLLCLMMLKIGTQKPTLSLMVQSRVALDGTAAGRGRVGLERLPLIKIALRPDDQSPTAGMSYCAQTGLIGQAIMVESQTNAAKIYGTTAVDLPVCLRGVSS